MWVFLVGVLLLLTSATLSKDDYCSKVVKNGQVEWHGPSESLNRAELEKIGDCLKEELAKWEDTSGLQLITSFEHDKTTAIPPDTTPTVTDLFTTEEVTTKQVFCVNITEKFGIDSCPDQTCDEIQGNNGQKWCYRDSCVCDNNNGYPFVKTKNTNACEGALEYCVLPVDEDCHKICERASEAGSKIAFKNKNVFSPVGIVEAWLYAGFRVQCDCNHNSACGVNETFGSTIIQRRVSKDDGSFKKSPQMYKTGFSENNDTWIGLQSMHVLTSINTSLLVELGKNDGTGNITLTCVKYRHFYIGNGSEFRLAVEPENSTDPSNYLDPDNEMPSFVINSSWWLTRAQNTNLNGMPGIFWGKESYGVVQMKLLYETADSETCLYDYCKNITVDIPMSPMLCIKEQCMCDRRWITKNGSPDWEKSCLVPVGDNCTTVCNRSGAYLNTEPESATNAYIKINGEYKRVFCDCYTNEGWLVIYRNISRSTYPDIQMDCWVIRNAMDKNTAKLQIKLARNASATSGGLQTLSITYGLFMQGVRCENIGLYPSADHNLTNSTKYLVNSNRTWCFKSDLAVANCKELWLHSSDVDQPTAIEIRILTGQGKIPGRCSDICEHGKRHNMTIGFERTTSNAVIKAQGSYLKVYCDCSSNSEGWQVLYRDANVPSFGYPKIEMNFARVKQLVGNRSAQLQMKVKNSTNDIVSISYKSFYAIRGRMAGLYPKGWNANSFQVLNIIIKDSKWSLDANLNANPIKDTVPFLIFKDISYEVLEIRILLRGVRPHECRTVCDWIWNGEVDNAGVGFSESGSPVHLQVNGETFGTYCDCTKNETDGLPSTYGWVVIQRLRSEFLSKYRSFYEGGTGQDMKGSYMLGLQNIHLLTKNDSKLQIELQSGTDNYFLRYQTFKVESRSNSFNLVVKDAALTNITHNLNHTGMLLSNGKDFTLKPASTTTTGGGKGYGWWWSNVGEDKTYSLNGPYDEQNGGVEWFAPGSGTKRYNMVEMKICPRTWKCDNETDAA